MTQAQGYRGQLVMDFEAEFGKTPDTPNGLRMPIQRSNIQSKQNSQDDQTIRNRRDPAMPSEGNIDVSGQVVVPVDMIAFGYWLKAIFGNPETTGDGPYTHVFKPTNVQPSLVLEQGFTDIGVYELFNGCKVGKISIPIGTEGDLVATMDIMGMKETIGATSFDATPTDIVLTKFTQPQLTIEEGGAEIAIVTEGTLDIDLGLDGNTYRVGGQGFRGAINEGLMQVTGNITAFFENNVLLNKAINRTESSLKLKWTNGTSSLEILIPELKFDRNSPGIDGPQGVRINLPFKGYYQDNSDNACIKVTLVNNQASYAA